MGQTLSILTAHFAVCRLDAGEAVPEWALAPGEFASVTRAGAELSVVCEERHVPDGVTVSRGWRGLKVEGPLDFALTGVMASLAAPLADAEISIFPVSTHDTDYLFVKGDKLDDAVDALRRAGHLLP